MGKAILHVHSTFSDGMPTVDEIMEFVETRSDVDVVGFTDHDDVRAYPAALAWKARHPGTRVQPLWGCEVTVWGFKHVLAFIFEPPFPATPWRKFLPLAVATRAIQAAGGLVIVPHVDAVWVGLGRRRLRRLATALGIHGYELLTPVPGGRRASLTLQQWTAGTPLVAVGGSDAHHLEDLFQVIVEFPGQSLADFHAALFNGTVAPHWGTPGERVPLRRQLRQHTRALVGQPSRQLRAWAGRAIVPPDR
ncbi:MAG TPA: PHP domain-containing protein [Chloroflexota bacterium]